MANNVHVAVTTRNTWLDALTTNIGTSSQITIFAGTQPADVSSATTAGNTTCATLTGPTTNLFGAASAGVLTANTITSDTNASGGTAAWFSIRKNTGQRVLDGSVGTSGSDLNLNSTTITTGATVAISAFTITAAA